MPHESTRWFGAYDRRAHASDTAKPVVAVPHRQSEPICLVPLYCLCSSQPGAGSPFPTIAPFRRFRCKDEGCQKDCTTENRFPFTSRQLTRLDAFSQSGVNLLSPFCRRHRVTS